MGSITLHLINEEAEAYRSGVTCPKSHRQEAVEPGSAPNQVTSRAHTLNTLKTRNPRRPNGIGRSAHRYGKHGGGGMPGEWNLQSQRQEGRQHILGSLIGRCG